MDATFFLLDITVLYSVYMILSVSLDLEYGEAGLPNFAKAAFFALGAFSVGALSVRLGAFLLGVGIEGDFKLNSLRYVMAINQSISKDPLLGLTIFSMTLITAISVSSIAGVLASYPALRLREDYLGMLLIAFSETIRVIARNYEPLVGGTFGVGVVDFLAWARAPQREQLFLLISIVLASLVWIVYYRLSTSPFGRALRAIRDNELATESLGRDVVKLRMKVMVLGSAMASVAGVIYAYYVGMVNPDDFTTSKTFLVTLMVIIGGRGNPLGAIAGPAVYLAFDRFIQFVKQRIILPFDPNYLSYIILGAILILIVNKRPGGLVPEKPTITLPGEIKRLLRRENYR
ncbi:MAG: branched-chain amino acid ABC transporter permease [Thermofilum sp.]|nr:branched-chain amino acid ABC transporter permease [Thermofilum sp.]